ncbi:Fic family protein [Lactobacillus johnsonii]|uniref:Fic family protein n=1 Tax=Lactobacillus johnsonii TaxID=33959 RepID=A0A9X7T7S2_LACJH|nr:Fic family protein [Lactobacillus johnsonii]QIA88566.1 Fic family protein [Lactobacillus johnsonii]QIA88581.1 Fic family protein [Lactobacillus johnsonii]
MPLKDKYHMSADQNRRLAKQNLTRLVYTNSRFEGLTTTLPQTQTIIDGLGVDGVSIDDINTIVQLKRGWQYIINDSSPFTFDKMKSINRIVALYDSLDPGAIRTGESKVVLASDDTYTPPIPNETQERKYFDHLINQNISTTDKAITLMYHNMRNQIFWDGNKRSATLAANKIMMDGGAGLINVPLDKWGKWNDLISDYYRTGNMEKIKEWTYINGIQGINL